MSTEFKTSSHAPTAGQQRQQASVLLLRLQWLLMLLMIGALLWMYVSQQRFQQQMNERLQSNEQVVTRLNEMDDRLFAINQQSLAEPNTATGITGIGSQAQNQLDLLRIQIQAADRLLADSDYQSAIGLLRGLQWQLSQSSNEIAPALTVVITQSLVKDIARLQAQSTQPNPWQLQNIAIQNIQEFLHSHERNDSHERSNINTALTRQQLTIHEVIMTLNLASQASNMRDQNQLTEYLRQARNELQLLVVDATATTKDKAQTTNKALSNQPVVNNKVAKDTPAAAKLSSTDSGADSQNSIVTMAAPKNIPEVIAGLDKLIANAPTSTPLLTSQILDQSKR
ncbi:hypothetical protein [Psychrobacter urativorans]|uniref:Uncharacterized protein n=1 Tax=Psychrobacter urativorans TaxID=45610 RepID=A0A0M4TVD2_9GAMM|nr:hypothetical protein [Psychrobacter urativorans]ALF59799.1 hypothetical protein AOC03_06910 [Psychrobacter urativorans]